MCPHGRLPLPGLIVAGPRTGLAPGTRSGLWHHIADAIRVLSPCLGLSCATQLRLLGNSVVPHQTARAMDILLPCGLPAQVPVHERRPQAEGEG